MVLLHIFPDISDIDWQYGTVREPQPLPAESNLQSHCGKVMEEERNNTRCTPFIIYRSCGTSCLLYNLCRYV